MAKEFHTKAIQHPIFKLIGEASDELGVDSYVIGGFVRDYFLKRNTPKDIDVVLWYNSNGFWSNAPQTPQDFMNTAYKRQKEMAWLKEIGKIRITFAIFSAQRVVVDYVDGHTEFDFFGFGINIDQVPFDGPAALQIDNRRYVGDFNAGKGPMHDGVSVQSAIICQRHDFHLIAFAALRAVSAFSQENCLAS